MIRVTGFVYAADGGADATTLDWLADVLRSAGPEIGAASLQVGRVAKVARGGGQLMALAAFTEADAYEAARTHPYLTGVVRPALDRVAAHVEVVRYRQGPVLLQDPSITAGIQRTLLIHVDVDRDPAAAATFERQLADMPRYIDAIRNSSLSRVDAVVGGTGPRWTHVWEQELATLDDLTGPYMDHPYHWGLVDTWFDPQAPNHLVDTTLIHAMCPLDRSLLALAGGDRS